MTDVLRDIPLHVVYRYPSDFRSHYVVRVQWPALGVIPTAPIACLYDTFDEIVTDYRDMTFLYRYPGDEPHIVGIFI